MSNFPLPLHADEALLKTDENAARVKNNLLAIAYNVIYGNLWLTSHRLVFQSSLLGSLVSYPLSRIRNARLAEVNISQRQTQYPLKNYDAALYVEFENGGKEYIIPQNIEEWAAAISDAKVAAPELPFTQTPPSRSAVELDKRKTLTIGAVVLGIVVLVLCVFAACIGVPIVVSFFS